MFERTYYATHPDMMGSVSNAELRDRYLVSGLFREGECVLNYTHADRFVIGGVVVATDDVRLPNQVEPVSAAGHPFLERRELAVVNVGEAPGVVTVDGEAHELGSKDCLYVTMGAGEVLFGGAGARFYLVSCPAHRAFSHRKLSIAQANALERGSLEEFERPDDLPARHSRHLRERSARHGPDRASAGQRLEHHAAPHSRAPLGDLFLFRTGRSQRPSLPFHGGRGGDAPHRHGQ